MSSPALSRPRPATRAAQPPRATAQPPRAAAQPPRAASLPRETIPLADAPPRSAGRFRYERRSNAWWWSAEMSALLCVTDATPPSTEVFLERHHPDDRARVVAALTEAGATARPFTLRTRVRHPSGPRETVLVGEPVLDALGGVTAVEGVCIDITDCPPADQAAREVHALQAEVEQLRNAMSSRAVIEQAKGILMLLTTCSDKVAFDLLTHISSHTHRKVRDVATAITASATASLPLPDDVRAILRDACPPQPAR